MAKYDKEALLASYHTGDYSQRELAKLYGVSNGTVGGLVKGLPKKNEQLIRRKVLVAQESQDLSQKELSAIEQSVSFKLGMLNDISTFSNSAMKKANDLLESSDTGNDFKAIVEGVDKLSITVGINHRHAPPMQIQQNTQTNENITRVFHVVE